MSSGGALLYGVLLCCRRLYKNKCGYLLTCNVDTLISSYWLHGAAKEDEMTETPKRGRKAYAPEHLRRGRNLRASDEEWSKIQAAAKRAGKGVTTWARETLVEAASEGG